MNKITSWGNLGTHEHQIQPLSHQLLNDKYLQQGPGIAYGMGRSYGDACLNPQGLLWKTRHLDRFIHFDEQSGCLTCEPGVLLQEIQQLFIPRGWMLPVSPGTQYVTVGGAIANDVHGKNHFQAGTLGHHVKQLQLLRTDGELITCSLTSNRDWFLATLGGVGLTGLIVQVEIQLKAVTGPWFLVEKIPFTSINEFFHLANASKDDWEYTVSWLDSSFATCRGIFMRANPLEEEASSIRSRKRYACNFLPPCSFVNRWTLKGLNAAYFYAQKKHLGVQKMHYEPFFYPLDHVQNWNRFYGPKGFYQYQCVIPASCQQDALAEMLRVIAHSNEGSCLSVLKSFGAISSLGFLSFPQEGLSLALDFPNRGGATETLFRRLDAIVAHAKGRLYLAKDARMPKALFEAGYPRWSEFMAYRDLGISSALSRRLMEF